MLKMPACRLDVNIPGFFTIEIPARYIDAYKILSDELKNKYNSYAEIHIGPPHKPRTTGPKSQNNLVHGFYKQISDFTGYSISEIKYKYALPFALKHGWPVEVGLDGKEYPIHESKASTRDINAEIQGIFDVAELAEVVLINEYGDRANREDYL